jgi:hypothetical protein
MRCFVTVDEGVLTAFLGVVDICDFGMVVEE